MEKDLKINVEIVLAKDSSGENTDEFIMYRDGYPWLMGHVDFLYTTYEIESETNVSLMKNLLKNGSVKAKLVLDE